MSKDAPIPIDRKRRRDAAMLADILEQAPRHVPALDDDAGWAAHDEALRAAAAKADARAARTALEKRAQYLIDRCGWPKLYVDDAMALPPDAGLLIKRAVRFAAHEGPAAADGRERRLLVLSSGVGAGKSTAAAYWGLMGSDSRPIFLRAAAIAAASRYDAKLRQRWEMASSLVIDDLGREYSDGKGNLLSDLEEIVDHCYSNATPIVMTTNCQPDTFWQRYGGKDGPIASRLRGAGAWYSSAEPDRRKP